MKPIRIAVLGATGLVGQTMVSILEEKDLPIEELKVFASSRSAGSTVDFKGEKLVLEELTEEALLEGKFDYALSALDSGISKVFSPIAASVGTVVIDNSSCFRMDENIPLVVPEVNGEDALTNEGIIANPNCSTIQSVVALIPILENYGIKRIVYNTYQAVSGSGVNGLEDLNRGLIGKKNEFYPHQIAFNALPHIDDFLDTGYTKEEMKMIDETRKMFHLPNLPITATTVRIPVRGAHSISINVETEKPVDLEELRKIYENTPGIVLEDDPKNNVYPLALYTEGKDEVFVGRLRLDPSVENGLNLWCTADNIRKGAALNAIQILEYLLNHNV
ncbi:aspartate-semialdehyde dehydrogenase [Peptoniphilus sp. KCTC 25270]|uniref:aspartate-semialdehyde dehydrogenase n=1 Tax=Peptoniphilus sp. KCTC 25270 TaxID=2897414 RepID=UPI001E46C661|nr:aspartate-semialdehyde dehydrogenase [Peptoniphilus sp. KCTC 25270]MCD1147953.1 aspartate-semialdehyde dehydrogenase [Peptoniphilus sp. KCTC 25270]